MKTPRIATAISYIDDDLITAAASPAKSKSKNIWLKWGTIAACMCFAVIGAVWGLNVFSSLGARGNEPKYGNTLAYVAVSEDSMIYDDAINKDKIDVDSATNLPIIAIDTASDLQSFISKYESVFDFDSEKFSTLSFNGAISKAQWNSDAFFVSNSLLVIYVPSTGGSNRFCIKEVSLAENSLCFVIEQTVDEDIIAEDSDGWFILVEIEDEEAEKYSSIDAVLDKTR